MPFAALALDFLLKNAPATAPTGKGATKPVVVDITKMQSSFADLSKEVLHCYHKTARFRTADKIQQPWERQSQYAAENSAVIRIKFTGISQKIYEMDVAVMLKENKVRTAVVRETAIIPYNTKCQLENWMGASSSGPTEVKKSTEKK